MHRNDPEIVEDVRGHMARVALKYDDRCWTRNGAVRAMLREIDKLSEALLFYANPNNTVRDCMTGGICANCDLCKLAQDTLGVNERGEAHEQER